MASAKIFIFVMSHKLLNKPSEVKKKKKKDNVILLQG